VTTTSPHNLRPRQISQEVRIRLAYPDDQTALKRLAGLDSQQTLEGDALIAELDGVAVAALSLHTGRVLADPFAHTKAVVELLRVRASRGAPDRRARGVWRRHRPATVGA
jgi:hypothetical protein